MEQMQPQLVEYLHNKADSLRIPINGVFEVSPVCNMNCKMCYVKKSQSEVDREGGLRDTDFWVKLGKETRDAGLLFLLLTGGEPFLRPDFREIYQELHKMGLSLSINSNGTMINDSTVKWLTESMPARINVTLYGASNDTYGRLCSNPKGFSQVCGAIDRLLEAGIRVKLNASMTPWNREDLKQMVEFAEQKGLVLQATGYMFPPLRKDATMIGQNQRFSPCEAACAEANVNIWQYGWKRFCDEFQHLESLHKEKEKELEGCGWNPSAPMRCRAGRSSFWVTWEGKLLSCGMMPEPETDLRNQTFMEAWRKIVSDVEDIRLPEACNNCDLFDTCRACGAMVYTETGTFSEVPKYRCQMMKEYLKIARELIEKHEKEGLII